MRTILTAGLVILTACVAPPAAEDADHAEDAGVALTDAAVPLDAQPEDSGAWYYCRAYYELVHRRCPGELALLCPFGGTWPVDTARSRLVCMSDLDCPALLTEIRRPLVCG
jgi:hypothetical protein